MRKTVIISLSGVLTVAVGVAAFAVWTHARKEPDVVNSSGGLISLGGDQADSSIPIAQNQPDSQTVVKGTTNMISDPTPLPNKPGATPDPSEFSQYEQYKNSDTALYVDLVVGTGPVAAEGSKLTVNYRGWLTNGKVFDESYTRGQPFSFTVGEHRVISGWEGGLVGMKVGGKRRLVVPPAAGYGAQATGPIPANSVLVFDVELIGVQ